MGYITPINIGLHIRHVLRFLRAYRSPQSSHNIDYPPDPFPADIWMQIINECWSRREWLRLCKTCKFFFQVARALLYKDITFDHFQGGKKNFGRKLRLFEKSLKNRPDLGALVHRLTLVDVRTRKPKGEISLLSCLHEFPNLKELRVQNLEDEIDSNLCYAIHSHPCLSSVSFSLCRLENSLTALSNQKFPGSSISHLHIMGLYLNGPQLAAFAPAGLRDLTVTCDVRHRFTMEQILSSLASAGKNLRLERLSIGLLSPSFADFLITASQLRHLTIDCEVVDHDPIFSSLPMDAIPLLEHFSGPVELSTLMLRNRPVRTVRLTHSNGIPMHNVIFASLQLSSVPVAKLEVLYSFAGTWLRNVPITVRDLTFLMDRGSLMAFLPYLSHLTDLHTICCKSRNLLAALSREEMTQISNVCPSLRELDISHDRWVMVKQSVWECFINLDGFNP